ncbi:MAG: tRNA (N6-isopentenyl adenosine(37)-C2)-methylthiotransferase MiaB [Deltaproteobacteria bacterium]|nr:tRNA (N6-isopentenyl adenosine(37)-C2)-methylthiotransferase MiaB [Deltaproteobacteria bacterium]
MNERDSHALLHHLAERGYERAATPHEADVLLLNTCSVRDHAEQKVYSTLGRFREIKQERPGVVIGVGGCVAQQVGESLFKRAPYLDLVFGTHHLGEVPGLIERAARERGSRPTALSFERTWQTVLGDHEAPDPGGVRAFVAVQRGCDRFCTFCIVPFTQGRELSRPSASVLDEVRRLAARGVKEVTLIGQNITSYGRKDPSEPDLGELLRRVHAVEGVERIRFLTSHPAEVNESLIAAFRDLERLAAHLHLPVQSGADTVLARMRRGHTRREYVELIELVRAARPEIAITTDLIAGFPGESESEFEATLSLVREVGFDNAFCFSYSPRPGTRALKLEESPDEATRADRLARLLAVQAEVRAERNQRWVGQEIAVLVERDNPRRAGEVEGRSPSLHPVHFAGRIDELRGTMVRVRVERAGAHALAGSPA